MVLEVSGDRLVMAEFQMTSAKHARELYYWRSVMNQPRTKNPSDEAIIMWVRARKPLS